MPRLLGVNIVAVLLAAIANFFVGFIFFGLVFEAQWMRETVTDKGLLAPGAAAQTVEQMTALFDARHPDANMGLSMGLGFVISLGTALGLALVLPRMRVSNLPGLFGAVALLWAGFAVTTLAYDPVYAMHSPVVFAINVVHTLCAYLAASLVIWALDGRNWAPRT